MTIEQTPCLIPVGVQACVLDPATFSQTLDSRNENGALRESSHPWAWHVPNYDKLDSTRAEQFDRIWPNLFNAVTPPELDKRSIVLTLSLPDGFSKPMHEDMASLPRLPDRWLWVRIVRPIHATDGSRVDEPPLVKTWIVDAGVITDDAASAPILTVENGQMAARRIGVVRTLRDAAQRGPDEPRIALHAQGTDACASMTFMSYAPMSLNNTSCIDSLDDVDPTILNRSAISYFVLGWYRDTNQHDPIVALRLAGKTDAEICTILDFVPNGSTPDVKLGERCCFHGLIAHIDYWNPRSYRGPAFGSPEAEPVYPCVGTFQSKPQKIGFGATPEDALAALAADMSVEDEEKEKLSADFFHMLHLMLLDRLDVHQQMGSDDLLRFATRDSTFQRVASDSEWTIGPAENTPTSGTNPVKIELTAGQTAQLEVLNDLQQRADKKQAAFASAAESLYTAWWQSLRARHRRKTALLDAVQRWTQATQSPYVDAQRLFSTIETAREQLQSSLDTTLGPNVAEVRRLTTNHYYLPKEPAIAIQNIGARLPPGSTQTTPRTLVGTAKEVANAALPRLTRASIRSALSEYEDPAFAEIFNALAEETSLVEATVASLVRTNSPAAGFHDKSDVQQWTNRNRSVRLQEPELEFVTTNDLRLRLDRLGAIWTEQAWIPLFLDWEVDWFPATDTTNPPRGTPLRGRTILASRPQRIIEKQLLRSHSMAPRTIAQLATCRHLIEQVRDWDVLAQTLSGLHQQLLLRDDLLPRPLPTDEHLHELVASTSLAPPNLTPNLEFDRLRRGHLRISRLWVVDAFGQAFTLDPTIKSAIAANGPQNSFALPTRLLEPSRLSLELAPSPNTKLPVRGWIVPSFADQAMIVYDPEGKPLGLVSYRSTPENALETYWRPAFGNGPKHPAELSDPILAAFLKPLVDAPDGSTRFDSLLKHIDEALVRTLPSESSTLDSPAAMLGRPLVLVRAQVRLDRRGGSIEDPTAMTNTTDNANPTAIVKTPIWIGARNRPDDGVLGFQLEDMTEPLQRTAKLVSGPPNGPPAFTLDAPADTQGTSVTLLMDPLGTMYFESDILPLQTLRLPMEWVHDIASKLPAVVRVAPALIGSHALLRSIFAPARTSLPNIDFPLPSGRNDSQKEVSAVFSVDGGVDVPVKPLTTTLVPDSSVAAIEGILVF